jgi:hypothetical protein
MTAQTPAPKASSVSALLASFSTLPPPPQPAAKEDFLAVILQALNPPPNGMGSPPSTESKKNPEKTAPADADPPADPPDVTAANLLLVWLAPPLPFLPPPLPKKGSTHSDPDVPLVPTKESASAPAPAQGGSSEPKPAKTVNAEKPPLSPLQVEPVKETENEPSTPGSTLVPGEEMPPVQVAFSLTKEADGKPAAISGTSVANTAQRMSFTPERNEIAGRTEQKLPPTGISAVSGADMGGSSSDGGAKSSLSFSWHDTPPEPVTITDLSALAASPTTPVTAATMDVSASVPGPAPLERLESMISHEALIIRQTGAQTLDVSLKLDSETQLYLQLTTHNGSVQASVRCERGTFAPEDAQWAQLQQSLARQNVSLLPMTGGSNLNFQQPSGQNSRQQQQAALREDWALPGAAVQPAQPRKQKEQNRSRNNWESWA